VDRHPASGQLTRLKLSSIALLVAVLPFVAVHFSYLLSAWQGYVEWCVPYWQGCTSISGTGRHGAAYFVFKGLMIPGAVLMGFYWWLNYQWLLLQGDKAQRQRRLILILGLIASAGLILYCVVLGSIGDIYRTQRRIGVVLYFGLTFLAQLLMTYRLSKLAQPALRSAYLCQLTICCGMWGLGIIHLVLEIVAPDLDAIDDIIEWNFALLVMAYYAGSSWVWRYRDSYLQLRQQPPSNTLRTLLYPLLPLGFSLFLGSYTPNTAAATAATAGASGKPAVTTSTAPNPASCYTLYEPDQVPFTFAEQTRLLLPQQWPVRPTADVRIGQIVFKRFPIFNLDDPQENIWLFRMANRLHINTREYPLRSLLLFAEGDPYNPRLLEESARLLRKQIYLYEAQVFPFRICDEHVDVIVVSRDIWTLVPGFSFSRTGGVNTSSFVVRESNLFGLGKRLGIERSEGVDRDGWELEYSDRNLFGSRVSLDLRYADNDDGGEQRIKLQRPFFALDTRWGLGVSAKEVERIDKLYLRGDSFAEFRTFEDEYSVSGGISEGWHKNMTRRWWMGFNWLQETFEPEPGEPAPAPFPTDRKINTLWFGREKIQDRFVTLRNFNQIYRTEDINLGKRWQYKLGWADSGWGSDRDRVYFDYSYNNLWQPDSDRLLSLQLGASGFWDQDNNRSDDIQLSNRWRYYRVDSVRTASYASLSLDYVRGLPAHKQLLLGGEEDLRGYPLRYQSGDRRVLLTLEKRFYSQTHWFRLFYVGAAAFVDIGRAWFPGQENSGATGVLSNVGLGFRLSSSRAESSRILHIDVAFPLEKEDDVDSVQVTLSGKQQF